VISGLLINDISDHLPVFTTLQHFFQNKNTKKQEVYSLKRLKTATSIKAFKKELNIQTWNEVYLTNDPNESYDKFLSIFIHLFNKHCPVHMQKQSKYEAKPNKKNLLKLF